MPDMPPKEAEPVVRLSVNLPADLHGEVRAVASAEGYTISEFVRGALEDACARSRRAEKKREAGQ